MIMKKQYISPVAEVFVCKTNAMLMASKFAPEVDSPSITPTDDEEITDEINSLGTDYDW